MAKAGKKTAYQMPDIPDPEKQKSEAVERPPTEQEVLDALKDMHSEQIAKGALTNARVAAFLLANARAAISGGEDEEAADESDDESGVPLSVSFESQEDLEVFEAMCGTLMENSFGLEDSIEAEEEDIKRIASLVYHAI